MKVTLSLIVVTFACLFLAVEEVSSAGLTIVGDVIIKTLNNGTLLCDSMVCPKDTTNCRVTKRNDPNNFMNIIRHRKCIDANGQTLEEEKIDEPNKSHGTVNVTINSGGGYQNSRPMTPQEQKELNEYIKNMQQQIQSQISSSMSQFWDGSFASNLQNSIRNTVQNALKG